MSTGQKRKQTRSAEEDDDELTSGMFDDIPLPIVNYRKQKKERNFNVLRINEKTCIINRRKLK